MHGFRRFDDARESAGRRQSRPFRHLLPLALIVCFSTVTAQDDQLRAALFSQHCATCHGAFGEGASAPDPTNPRWHGENDDARIDGLIRDGVPGRAMPAFGAELDAGSRSAVIAHLRELSNRSVQPTTEVHTPEIRVDDARLLEAEGDSDNWLMYGRDYGNGRYTPLSHMNRETGRNLVPVWSFQTGVADDLHATPLVIDGVIYLSTAWNHVFSIDARNGAELWHYRRSLPEKLKYCCGPVNWGVAILGDTLFLGTVDAHLVAIEARSGRVRWDIEVGKPEDNLSIKSVPLVVKARCSLVSPAGNSPTADLSTLMTLFLASGHGGSTLCRIRASRARRPRAASPTRPAAVARGASALTTPSRTLCIGASVSLTPTTTETPVKMTTCIPIRWSPLVPTRASSVGTSSTHHTTCGIGTASTSLSSPK